MVFSKFLWVFGIGLFVSSNTYKGKAAYFGSPQTSRKRDHTRSCCCCCMSNLVLHEDFERTKEILKLKDEFFVTNFTKLEKESLNLKERIESLLVENRNLHEQLKQVEIDQAANKRWPDSSNALNWLNTHHT